MRENDGDDFGGKGGTIDFDHNCDHERADGDDDHDGRVANGVRAPLPLEIFFVMNTTVARLVSLSLDVTNNIYCGRPGHHKNRRHHHHHRPRPRPPPPPSSSSFSPSSPPSSSSLSPHGHRHCDCHHNHHYLVFIFTILNFLVMTMMMAIVVMALIIAMTTMDYDDDDVGLVVMMANMVRVVFLVAS